MGLIAFFLAGMVSVALVLEMEYLGNSDHLHSESKSYVWHMATNPKTINSLDTILTFDNKDVPSQWSVVVSTTHIPGMDNAAGGGPRRNVVGRRQLRFGALAIAMFLTMHARVVASALTGGFFLFLIFSALAISLLANPLRHFEVYLGEWSISGPGRAFRIIPVLDGIGFTIAINALVRAINCCTIASIAAMYVRHSVADSKLPFTYCRDFELNPYEPVLKDVRAYLLREPMFSLPVGDLYQYDEEIQQGPVSLFDIGWQNKTREAERTRLRNDPYQIEMCEEQYTTAYPALYSTPAYNFFFVEVVSLRSNYKFGTFNIPLVPYLIMVWVILWILMVVERIQNGRLIWNNMSSWLVVIPCIWVTVLLITAFTKFVTMSKPMIKLFRIGNKEVIAGLADAFEVALYVHGASVGTEIIHGKGLNHYAAGHIDQNLNNENVWHSGLLLLMIVLHSSGAAICALLDCLQPSVKPHHTIIESTVWIIPMYSKCVVFGNYSHLASTLLFGGLMISYMTVAYVLLKTALHTIFEYKVKLVFAEQFVVAGVILCCMVLSFLSATGEGIALLESVDAIMTGVTMPFVCLLELTAILYVYRGHDFVSDMNVATEENVCATRMNIQWQMIPFIILALLVTKATSLPSSELPATQLALASAPLAAATLAVPVRALYTACRLLRPGPAAARTA